MHECQRYTLKIVSRVSCGLELEYGLQVELNTALVPCAVRGEILIHFNARVKSPEVH